MRSRPSFDFGLFCFLREITESTKLSNAPVVTNGFEVAYIEPSQRGHVLDLKAHQRSVKAVSKKKVSSCTAGLYDSLQTLNQPIVFFFFAVENVQAHSLYSSDQALIIIEYRTVWPSWLHSLAVSSGSSQTQKFVFLRLFDCLGIFVTVQAISHALIPRTKHRSKLLTWDLQQWLLSYTLFPIKTMHLKLEPIVWGLPLFHGGARPFSLLRLLPDTRVTHRTTLSLIFLI